MFLLLALVPSTLAASPLLNLLPLGVGVYAHGRPVRGLVYTATQAAGAATWTVATLDTWQAETDGREDDVKRGQALCVGAATVTLGSYLVGLIDGSRLHELEMEAREGAPVGWMRGNDPYTVGFVPPTLGAAPPTLRLVPASATTLTLQGIRHDD